MVVTLTQAPTFLWKQLMQFYRRGKSREGHLIKKDAKWAYSRFIVIIKNMSPTMPGITISALILRQYHQLLQESLAISGTCWWTPSPHRNYLKYDPIMPFSRDFQRLRRDRVPPQSLIVDCIWQFFHYGRPSRS